MVTLEQHFETFLHTYIPTRGRKGEVQEDNLDCPLVELGLLARVGERETDRIAGRREPIYNFNREEKPEITSDLFVYCLNDFWRKRHPNDETLPFREVAHGHGSPGQIFKLPRKMFGYGSNGWRAKPKIISATTNHQFCNKSGETVGATKNILLNAIYTTEAAYA